MDPSFKVGFHTNSTIVMFQKEREVLMEEKTDLNLENYSETAVSAGNFLEKTVGK